MTTEISISDSVHETAEQAAQQLGIPLGELYENAITRYLQELQAPVADALPAEKSVTERLNEFYSKHDSSLDPVLAEIQARSIPHEEW